VIAGEELTFVEATGSLLDRRVFLNLRSSEPFLDEKTLACQLSSPPSANRRVVMGGFKGRAGGPYPRPPTSRGLPKNPSYFISG